MCVCEIGKSEWLVSICVHPGESKVTKINPLVDPGWNRISNHNKIILLLTVVFFQALQTLQRSEFLEMATLEL